MYFYFREINEKHNFNSVVHGLRKNSAKKDFYFYQGKYFVSL